MPATMALLEECGLLAKLARIPTRAASPANSRSCMIRITSTAVREAERAVAGSIQIR